MPFCARRCDYCDFATWTDRHHLMEAYARACVVDLGRRYGAGDLPPADTVFFGGGTPSLLPAELLGMVLEAVPRAPGAEVTLEANPDTVTDALLASWRSGGVNRLSLGVQSMVPHVLASLGRTHDPDNVTRAAEAARAAGFTRINLDLIYGAAGETAADWRATLDAALALDPPHLSAYALTVEPGTPLWRRVSAGEVAGPDDDVQADRYLAADAVLAGAGLRWYEISNWARPGEECRHNRLYWRQGAYLGIGCAAHGHSTGLDGEGRPVGRRWWTVRQPERYIDLVGRGLSPEAGSETVAGAARLAEAVMLGLRTREGIATDVVGGEALAPWVAGGHVAVVGGRAVLTATGRLLASEVTNRLLDSLGAAAGRGDGRAPHSR